MDFETSKILIHLVVGILEITLILFPMKNPMRNYSYALLLFLFILSSCKEEQKKITSLPRTTPEAEGVSSQGIIDFLDAAAKSSTEFHSIMILRHGKVIAEGWWDPYKPALKHTLYSTSKSFTATALGLAVAENRLSVDDKVISFFPDALPDSVSTFLSNLKVKDLLSMTAGQEPDPTFGVVTQDSNWVKSFLAIPVVHEPGTKFLYNTLATYMLSAIIQKATGEKLIDYLKPRLFDPLSIEGMDWEVDPLGINTGGWGLRLKTEDMAKFGQLFLQKGKWNGEQILPVAWIEEATSKKIEQAPDATQAKRDSSDWLQGYCYQMWRCRNNCYRADGAYGQYIIVMPEQDAVVAITAESPNMQDEINLVWEYILPAMGSDKLPENSSISSTLNKKLTSLALPLESSGNSPVVARISGKTFIIEPNDMKVKTMSLQFHDSICNLSISGNSGNYDFYFGAGHLTPSETEKIGPNLLLLAKAHYVGLPVSKVAGNFRWKDNNTLELMLRYIESPHTEIVTCRFDNDFISVETGYSNMPDYKQPALRGVLKN
jgi:CubicO group peptidase (beta-lactamase class C family)